MVLTLGDVVNVALSHGGGLFSTAHAVDNGKDFVRARPGVTTQVAVGDLQYQSVTAHLTTQELLDVSGSVVLAVVGANDLQILVAGARPRRVASAGIAAVTVKLTGVNTGIFAVGKLANAPARVASRDAQSLLRANSRVTAHVLVADLHHAVAGQKRAHAIETPPRHVDFLQSSSDEDDGRRTRASSLSRGIILPLEHLSIPQ